MRQSPLFSSAISLWSARFGAVAETRIYNPPIKKLALIPTIPFTIGDSITCSLSSGIVDSFGNPLSPTSFWFKIKPRCAPAIADVICPIPCFDFTTCDTQTVKFFIKDTTGANIDTMRTFFTAIKTSAGGGTTILNVHEPSLLLRWVGDSIAIIGVPAVDRDSVFIRLDSLFNSVGCRGF